MESKFSTGFSFVDDKGNVREFISATVYLSGTESSFKHFTDSLIMMSFATIEAIDAIDDTKAEGD